MRWVRDGIETFEDADFSLACVYCLYYPTGNHSCFQMGRRLCSSDEICPIRSVKKLAFRARIASEHLFRNSSLSKNNDPDSRTVWVGSFAFPASLICSSLSQGVWTHVIPKFTSKFFPYFLTWGLWREGSHKHRIICTKTGPLLASLNLLVGGGSL